MKKIVLSTVIGLGLAVNASGGDDAISNGKEIFCKNFKEQHVKELCEKAFDDDSGNSEVNGFIAGVAGMSSSTAEVIIDYLQSKTCKNDFREDVTVESMKDFSSSVQFGTLLAVHHMDYDLYKKMIQNYKFINCGTGSYSSSELEELKKEIMTDAEK